MFPIMQLAGKAATGKSLFFNDLRKHALYANRTDIKLVNIYDCAEISTVALSGWIHQFVFIVIDNADLLITEQLQHMISDSVDVRKNHWVLIGRRDYWCVSPKCVGKLLIQDDEDTKKIYVSYS
jgi:hypothetical protein